MHPGITASAAVALPQGCGDARRQAVDRRLIQWYVLIGSLVTLGAGTLASAMAGTPARRNTPREG